MWADAVMSQLAEDLAKSVEWARSVLADPTAVILDSETTDLTHADFVELAILRVSDGQVLFNERLRPVPPIKPGAGRVHGLTAEMLRDCRTFGDVYKPLSGLLAGRRVIVYNASFDWAAWRCAMAYHHIKPLPPVYPCPWECAMVMYAMYIGDWSDWHGDYRWQPLRGADHSALGDCRATLAVLREMAR